MCPQNKSSGCNRCSSFVHSLKRTYVHSIPEFPANARAKCEILAQIIDSLVLTCPHRNARSKNNTLPSPYIEAAGISPLGFPMYGYVPPREHCVSWDKND